MARIIQHFIADGRQLHEPEIVQLTLTQGIRTKNEQVQKVQLTLTQGIRTKYEQLQKIQEWAQ